MITKKSIPHTKLRSKGKYGDLIMVSELLKFEYLLRLIYRDKMLPLMMFVNYLEFLIAMFANSIVVFFRFRHGMHTMGLIMMVSTSIMIMVFNSANLHFILKPFTLPFVALLPFFKDWHWIYAAIVMDIHSLPLLVFLCMYLLVSLVHSIFIFIGKGNVEYGKRGDSWIIWLLEHKWIKVDEYLVQGILEPFITALIALLFWYLGNEVFAIYLWVAASCLFIQELQEQAKHMENRPPVRNQV